MIPVKWWPRPSLYQDVWQAMQDYTEQRDDQCADQLWLVEHAPVYTLGQAGKPEHILNSGAIPIVHSNRGGQVTYHGPGQIVVYCLIDLRRQGLFVKEYVALLEEVIIGVLAELGLPGACRKPQAPGVYVPVAALRHEGESRRAPAESVNASVLEGLASAASLAPPDDELAKIAALGIKVSRGCAYHGLALNVDMDLSPYLGINPCGYEGLRTVDLASCGVSVTVEEAGDLLAVRLNQALAAHKKV